VDTFLWDLQLSALDDLDGLYGFIVGTLGDILDLADNIVAFKNLSEDNVAAIEPTREGSTSELQRQPSLRITR
jgi:hypothetical protein